ncbi:adenylyl-sulfate kinase [Chitinophaga sp.]|uniref:adenylyl-sulfate kinase n=1 Tax=Chitinophaga sp. TaxID=1869181 RepID=UPI0031D7D9FD
MLTISGSPLLPGEHKEKVLWFTGLSGAGKTTLSKALYDYLITKGIQCITLDGDELRQGINVNLGFTKEDRTENIRRTAEIARLLVNNGIFCIVSTISPYPELRSMARDIIGHNVFFEIFINAPLAICEERDVKGLYKKARQNKIASFTGVHDAYIPPVNPDLEIRTDLMSVNESLEMLVALIEKPVPFPLL